MSRLLLYYIFILIAVNCFCLSGCSSSSLEGFHDKGVEITCTLIDELENIQSRDDLLAAAPRLKQLFLMLVKTSIAAQDYQEKQAYLEQVELTQSDHIRSEKIRQQLQRIYRIEGCREIMEKSQQDALNLLDSYQQQLQRRRSKL